MKIFVLVFENCVKLASISLVRFSQRSFYAVCMLFQCRNALIFHFTCRNFFLYWTTVCVAKLLKKLLFKGRVDKILFYSFMQSGLHCEKKATRGLGVVLLLFFSFRGDLIHINDHGVSVRRKVDFRFSAKTSIHEDLTQFIIADQALTVLTANLYFALR